MDMFFLLQRFQDFRRTFQGDPQQMIKQMMDTGRISQNDYETAVEKAKQFMNMFRNPCARDGNNKF